MGLLYLEFQDTIHEGKASASRVKVSLLIFRATGHTNYTLEAFILSSQYYYLFPPRQAE